MVLANIEDEIRNVGWLVFRLFINEVVSIVEGVTEVVGVKRLPPAEHFPNYLLRS